jgi:hypothetical protein
MSDVCKLTVHNDTRHDQDPEWQRELEHVFELDLVLLLFLLCPRPLGVATLHVSLKSFNKESTVNEWQTHLQRRVFPGCVCRLHPVLHCLHDNHDNTDTLRQRHMQNHKVRQWFRIIDGSC